MHGSRRRTAIAPPPELPQPAQRHVRRNFFALMGEGVLFVLAMAFLEATTLLPNFIRQLTGSAVLVGLVVTLRNIGWIAPQLIMAYYVIGRPRRPILLWTYLGSRVPLGVFALLVYLDAPASALTVAFFVAIGCFYVGDGISSVPWYDVAGAVIPARQRGRLFGWQQSFGGVMGFAAGFVIQGMIASGGVFPRNYAPVFLAAFVVLALSGAAFLPVREPRGSLTSGPRPAIGEFLATAAAQLRHNGPLRSLLQVMLIAGVAGMALPFYIVFAAKLHPAVGDRIGYFVSAQTLGVVIGGFLWAYVSDHAGNRWVIWSVTGLQLLLPGGLLLLGVFPGLYGQPVTFGLLLGAFVLLGVVLSGGWLGYTAYLLEIAAPAERGLLIALMHTVLLPVALFPLLGGWLAHWTSHELVLFVAAAGAGASLAAAVAMPEPRRAGSRSP